MVIEASYRFSNNKVMISEPKAEPGEASLIQDGLITTLKNGFTTITIDPSEKKFYGSDDTDTNNIPSFYNTKKQSFRRAAAALLATWAESAETMTMNDACNILLKNNNLLYCF